MTSSSSGRSEADSPGKGIPFHGGLKHQIANDLLAAESDPN